MQSRLFIASRGHGVHGQTPGRRAVRIPVGRAAPLGLRSASVAAAIACALGFAQPAAAALPSLWLIDPSVSSVSLDIPNFLHQGVTVSVHNQTGSTAAPWNATHPLGGSLHAPWDPVNNLLTFPALAPQDIRAVNPTNFRPNPNAWNSDTEAYTNTSQAAANIGGRLRALLDIAYFSLSDLVYGLYSPSSAPLPTVSTNVFDATGFWFGIAEGLVHLDAVATGTGIVDLRNEPISLVGGSVAATPPNPLPTITIDPVLQTMTFDFSVQVSIELSIIAMVLDPAEGDDLFGTAAMPSMDGIMAVRIVAHLVPEPSSAWLAAPGLAAAAWGARRKRSKRFARATGAARGRPSD